jgi:hypothetical protein
LLWEESLVYYTHMARRSGWQPVLEGHLVDWVLLLALYDEIEKRVIAGAESALALRIRIVNVKQIQIRRVTELTGRVA